MSLQILLNGIFLGAIYANIAVGFSLAWGVMDVINVAHGTMIVIGSFVTFFLFKTFGLDPFLSIPFSMFVLFVIGYFSQKYLLNFVVKVGVFLSLILTFGLDLFLINARSPDLYRGLSFDHPFLFGGLFPGRAIYHSLRAAGHSRHLHSINRAPAVLFEQRRGLATPSEPHPKTARPPRSSASTWPQIYSITLAISAALAGACGSLISIIQSFTPFEGGFFIMKAFIICVLGGLGNVMGAIVGGLLLGVVETMGARILGTGFQEAISAIIMILVLIFLPKGIVGSKYK